MKISPRILKRYTEVPSDNRALRGLLDDVGVEVKRVEGDGDDAIFTLELLANRGDHRCYAGVARELSGRTGLPVRWPEIAALTVGASPVPLVLETDLCLQYTATLLERAPGAPLALPAAALLPLEDAGIHSLTAPVDATNLSNLELGQPTHAFDADAIDGRIVVRLSREGEPAWPLFSPEPVALPPGLMVIADDSKVLAIAGVIGCEESKTTEATTRLLLESAAFDPVSVRKAKRAMGALIEKRANTDSAARFERGSDPARPLQGAGRVVALLEGHAGWRRVGETGAIGGWSDPARTLRLDAASTNRFLQLDLGADEIAERLSRYGFQVASLGGGHLEARVPTWRLWDVEFRADLYEEIAKSVGYNQTPTTLPAVEMGALPARGEVVRERAEEVLLGHGFYEVITDGFYGKDALDLLDAPEGHPLLDHVRTLNSLERGYSLLKNNALAQALQMVADNLRRRHDQIKAYEWTRTFHPAPAEGGASSERALLWALVCGEDREPSWAKTARPGDALFLKGVVEELGTELGLPLTFGPVSEDEPLRGLLHPRRRVGIYLDGAAVGVLGEVHPEAVQRARIKRARPCYLELSAAALEAPARHPTYAPPPQHQPLVRSLAFGLPMGVTADEVAEVMRSAAPGWLDAIAVTDRFDYADEGAAMRAITWRLSWRNDDGQRSADEVNVELEALVGAVHAALGQRGVAQRT